MANIQIGTANGSTLGNPPSGDFYIFIDSNNSNSYTLRDSSGTDTILGTTGGYFKAEVLITSGSISASASDQAVPGLTYTIPTGKNGNYVFYAVLSVDIAGTDMKPMSLMVFKNGVKETNSVTMDFAKKNENQSLQLTYALDGLVATDVIAIYVNNDNVDINTIITGRILAQKFE
jgi:hypothetical protein